MKNTRWLCVVSLALNVAEAKVVAASLYGPLPPTLSPRSSSPFFHSHHNIVPLDLTILPCSRHRNTFLQPLLFQLATPPAIYLRYFPARKAAELSELRYINRGRMKIFASLCIYFSALSFYLKFLDNIM